MNSDISIIKITNEISYIPACESPILSADIGIVSGGNSFWIYDVGAIPRYIDFLDSIEEHDINIIGSHFHKDHLYNLNGVRKPHNLYCSKYTYNHYKSNTNLYFNNVDSELFIEDGNYIHIFSLPSSHCKGCIGLEINEEYAFIGDAYYCNRINGRITYNRQLLQEQIKAFTSLKADKLLISHDKEFIVEKKFIIEKLEKILGYAKKDNPYIIIE